MFIGGIRSACVLLQGRPEAVLGYAPEVIPRGSDVDTGFFLNRNDPGAL